MATLREARESVLFAYNDGFIDEETCLLLYDINKSKNIDLPYWNYERFDLDLMTDEECRTDFRFWKNDVYVLCEALQIPPEFICYNGLKVSGLEAMCVFLRRFAYPCRYSDIMCRFGRPVPQLSMISNLVVNRIPQFRSPSYEFKPTMAFKSRTFKFCRHYT